MRVFSLFELFLAVVAFYAIVTFEGGMRTLFPILCLSTIFLFEILRETPKKQLERRPL